VPEDRFQFERLGYFCVDSENSSEKAPVFNRTMTLRDAWVKIAEKGKRRCGSNRRRWSPGSAQWIGGFLNERRMKGK
jgi:glutaminyl-tRNA synthetase